MSTLFVKRATYISIASLSTAALYYAYTKPVNPLTDHAKMLQSYQATYCVPLSCESCVRDVSAALSTLPGIKSTTFSLASQLITTTGTAPPSAVISTIQSTGRPAILRGSGATNSAAVCILEVSPSAAPVTSKPFTPPPSPVRGLARLIQLSPALTLLDLSLSALPAGAYAASLRSTGDISRGPLSMGDVHKGDDGNREGELGTVVVDDEGRGALVKEVGWRVWEMVGRGMIVQRVDGGERITEGRVGDTDTVVGVVARSAGVWENDKVVCACSGKTVWEEREEMIAKGMA